jgi:putative N6-adenine-specific DNA methylase
MHDQRSFFLTTIPGLESVTHLELCDKWGRAADFFDLPSYPQTEIIKGGVLFQAPLQAGLSLHPFLRTPTRMLLRLAEFSAPTEKDFVGGLKQVNLKDFYKEKSHFDFKFTSKSSKLSKNHQIQKVLENEFKSLKVKYKKGGPTLFLRIFRDQCTISMDCTGEGAFKRGKQSQGSIASLRSSTAQGLLRVLLQGVKGPYELIDPMCGAGTFLQEALLQNEPLSRDFSFQNFPVFQDSQWSPSNSEQSLLQKLVGFDINDKALYLSEKNMQASLKAYAFDPEPEWLFEKRDLFDEAHIFPRSEGLKRLVVLNPPWGKRLPGASQDILKAVCERFDPDRIGLLMPARWRINPINLEKVRDLPILNSGVENRFLLFAKSPQF